MEATYSQYLFSLIFYLVIVVFAYVCFRMKKDSFLLWVLAVVFCLYAYWDDDYFSYQEGFFEKNRDFKEILYSYLIQLAHGSYIMYRLLIWGTGILFFNLASRKLKVPRYVTNYVFCVFFLPIFSYARVSLAMALYFYGITLLSCKSPNSAKFLLSFIMGWLFVLLSYFAHRSFLPIILLTPLAFIRYNKPTLILVLIIVPFATIMANEILSGFLTNRIVLDDWFNSFSESATRYAELSRRNRNWKFELVFRLRNISFYVPFVYIIFKTYFAKRRVNLPKVMQHYLSATIMIGAIATIFLLSVSLGATDIIGYRYLFMSGIPITFLLAQIIDSDPLSTKWVNFSMIFAVLAMVVFVGGKLMSLE